MKSKTEKLLTKLIKNLTKKGSNSINGTYGNYKIKIEKMDWEFNDS